MTRTRRNGWLALALLVACADDLPNANPPELHDLDHASATLQEAAQAVVRIQHPNGSSGTGSFISADGLLLTNAHVLGGEVCAREGCELSISFQHQLGTLGLPPREAFAVPQHVDVGLDMAVVQIFLDAAKTQRLPTPHFLQFEPRHAAELVGEHVTAIGHPLGRLKKWSAGYVISADGEWFDTSIFSLPGGSGSPMLNDAGRIVGLLHRGAEGFDLLTETSTQVAAVGSASAELQAALAAPLPASVISLADSISTEQALTYTSAFLAGNKWEANVDGQPLSLVWLLGTDCDEALAREDYGSIEELQNALGSCFTALDFIECRQDVFEQARVVPRQCPSDRATWLQRLRNASDKQRRFNGTLDLSSISYSTEGLADNQDAAEQAARANIVALLDQLKPKLDFTIGSYLTAYGIETYDNQSVRDFYVNYRKQPFYERYAWQITTSTFWLYSSNQLSRKQALDVAKQLYRDDKVSIGAKLRIADVLYNSDEL